MTINHELLRELKQFYQETKNMTKIEPVSKATSHATFFMSECLKHKLIILDAPASLHPQKKFAAFCRAVADQLDPVPVITQDDVDSDMDFIYTTDTSEHVLLTKTIMRKVFRAGFDYARDESKVKVLNMGIPYELPTEMIDIELKKQGLLGDKEND